MEFRTVIVIYFLFVLQLACNGQNTIYTEVDSIIYNGESLIVDINQDSINDFELSVYVYNWQGETGITSLQDSNLVMSYNFNGWGYPYRYNYEDTIFMPFSNYDYYNGGGYYMTLGTTMATTGMSGSFLKFDSLGVLVNVYDGFIGLKFKVGADYYYGWISVDCDWNHTWLTLNSFAYSNVPNQPIVCSYDSSLFYTEPEEVYFEFPDSNSIWSVATMDDSLIYTKTMKYGIIGDTIINSVNYGAIGSTLDSVFDQNFSTYFCAVREEDKKWYFIEQGTTQPKLLYDFNVAEGDTLLIDNPWLIGQEELVIEFIDSIQIQNGYRRRINLTNSLNVNDSWIEGVGSVNGLLYAGSNFIDDSYQLICFEEHDTLRYLESPNGSCFIYEDLGIQPQKLREAIKIYPNPFQDEINIHIDQEGAEVERIEIITMEGVIFKQYSLIDTENQIQIKDNLPAGIYLVRICYNGYSYARKVVKY